MHFTFKQLKVSPLRASGIGTSIIPPTNKSISLGCLYTRDACAQPSLEIPGGVTDQEALFKSDPPQNTR